MQPYLKEKLVGMHFDNLGTLVQRVAAISKCVQPPRQQNRFPKAANVADYYMKLGLEEEDEEVDAIEWNINKKFIIEYPWGGTHETFDFDTSKADKIFDYLLKQGQIKVLHEKMLSPEEIKGKKYCKVHNSTTHSTNECNVFRKQIQKAIEAGKLVFDTGKMKVDQNPFAVAMADVVLPKGKAKVLTSARVKESGIVDSRLQLIAEGYQEIKRRREKQNSRFDQPESSASAERRPRVTSRILLNK